MIGVLPMIKITTDLISSEIIRDTSKKIYSSIGGIYNYNVPHVNKLIEKLDIQMKIEIVKSLFETNNNSSKLNNTLVIALNNLQNISKTIEKELKEIEEQVEYSKTIYFAYFRECPYAQNLENLITHSKILDNRLDLVIKLLGL